MNRKSLDSLEYKTVLGIISLYTDSIAGKEAVRGILPLSGIEEILDRLNLVKEIEMILSEVPGFGLGNVTDISQILNKRIIKGTILEIEEILQVKLNLESADNTRHLVSGIHREFEHLNQFVQRLHRLSDLSSAINSVIDSTGKIKDTASYELKEIRSSIASLRKSITKILEEHLQDDKYQYAIQDDVITQRTGRSVLMIKADFKGVVKGIIHDSSSSGQSVFVEPMEVVEMNNRVARLEQEEKVEIRKILTRLTGSIFENNIYLDDIAKTLIELDMLQAISRFTVDGECVIPLISEKKEIDIIDARHPLLDERLRSKRNEFLEIDSYQDHKVVPISLNLDDVRRGMVISGPNMGGKTVSLKTFGLLSLMAQSGIPVPAKRFTIPVFEQVFVDIGDQQAITRNMSTFSSHLINIKEAIDNLEPLSLVLLDEVGTGTDPEEGAALARSIVDYFIEKGCFILITTHSNYLKTYSYTSDKLKSASVEFDSVTGKPSYRLIEGSPGSSKAFDIARTLGFPASILDNAKSHIESGHQYMEEFVEKLEATRKEYEKEIQVYSTRQLEIKAELEKVKEERLRMEDTRRKLAMNFKEQLGNLLEKYSDKVHEIIEKINDTASRLELKRMASEQLKQMQDEIKREPGLTDIQHTPEFELPHELPEGTRIKLKMISGFGTLTRGWKKEHDKKMILDYKGKTIETNPADVIDILAPAKKETAGEKIFRTYNLEKTGRAENELNIIGKASDEVDELVFKFIDDAMIAGLKELRIVHGKGKGILKKTVQELLKTHPSVKSFSTAPGERGGEGATEVTLE